ncbi:hypothetical protein, partial [Thermosynechococcus sp.]|uniref:hypothetical protein n=1 Tax=Thermosynechococcus sp. TaxID=2814275 RepID=UPI003918A49E
LERSKNVGLVKFVMNWITSAYELMIKEFSTELDGLLVSVILHVLDNEDMCIREIGKKFIDSRINALSLI